MIKRLQDYLGLTRLRALIALSIITGGLSTVALLIESPISLVVQNLMFILFLAGCLIIFGSRLTATSPGFWLALLAPAFGLILIGGIFFPQIAGFFTGGALGWILVGLLIFGRSRAPMEYRLSVKAMRKGQLDEAVKIMDGLIRAEPREPNHYHFRAQLLRLWGKLGRARRDYETMLEHDPSSVIAYNGLAEVELQAGHVQEALKAAEKAHALAPDDWVTGYNLGMIQDRLGQSEQTLQSLSIIENRRIPDARHRLLIQLYRVRAAVRLGNMEQASLFLDAMRREKKGLKEWETILESPEATVLRAVLEKDVVQARELLEDGKALENIALGVKI